MNTYLKTLALACALTSFTFADKYIGDIDISKQDISALDIKGTQTKLSYAFDKKEITIFGQKIDILTLHNDLFTKWDIYEINKRASKYGFHNIRGTSTDQLRVLFKQMVFLKICDELAKLQEKLAKLPLSKQLSDKEIKELEKQAEEKNRTKFESACINYRRNHIGFDEYLQLLQDILK